jgi:hypothetical protein
MGIFVMLVPCHANDKEEQINIKVIWIIMTNESTSR